MNFLLQQELADHMRGGGESHGDWDTLDFCGISRYPIPLPRNTTLLLFFPIHPTKMAQTIVVGGGLAGLSAAHTLLERGANVLLLDKQG